MKRLTTTRPLSSAPGQVQTENLMSVISDARGVIVDIPDTATLKDVEKLLEVACKGVWATEQTRNRLLNIIGRILVRIDELALWRPAYANFTEFIEKRVVADMGIGRSTAFAVIRAVRVHSQLPEDEFQRIGISKLLEAAKITDEKAENYHEVLQKARTSTVEEFREYIKTQRESNVPDEEKMFLLGLRISAENMRRWQGFRDAEPDRDADATFGAMCDLYFMKDQLTTRVPVAQAATARRRAS